jgi:hypothetical protein
MEMLQILRDVHNSVKELQITIEKILLYSLYSSLKNEYNREIYAWQYFEDACEEWYIDHANFWDDNYFQLPFDDSTQHYVEGREEKAIHPSFSACTFSIGSMGFRSTFDIL